MPNVPERNDASEDRSVAAELIPRIGRLEADVSQLKVDVAGIKATLPHLATKADLATMESRLIRWIAGSWIAMAGVVTAVVTAAVRFAH